MALRCANDSRAPGLLAVSFNQDATCACLATMQGVSIFNVESQAEVFRLDIGAIRSVLPAEGRCPCRCAPARPCPASPASGRGRLDAHRGAVRARHTPCGPALLPRSVAEMLFCTSLLAFVGAGEQPTLTPRKLTLFNTHNNAAIQNLSFPSSVLSVLLNRRRWARARPTAHCPARFTPGAHSSPIPGQPCLCLAKALPPAASRQRSLSFGS